MAAQSTRDTRRWSALLALGCSEVDSHIPAEQKRESAQVFRQLGAQINMCLYPKTGHTINDDETAFVRRLVQRAVES